MGDNAFHQLQEKASQLGALLNTEGRKEKIAWFRLRNKLAAFATRTNPNITTPLGSHGKEMIASPDLGHKEAEALLRQMMEAFGRIGADGSNPIPLKDLIVLVADKLSMIPLCDCPPKPMIDGGMFEEDNVEHIVSDWVSPTSQPYGVVSIVGTPTSGKSFLLNRLFGSQFPVMNKMLLGGRIQRANGIMMSRSIGPSLLILDLKGFDGSEWEDKQLDNQLVLFSLSVSDLIMINISEPDIFRMNPGRSFFEVIFQARTKLPRGLTKMIVVLRRCDDETTSAVLDDVIEKMKKMWESVHSKTKEATVRFEDYIEVNIIALPDKMDPNFDTKVNQLRNFISKNSIDHHKGCKVPASSFIYSSKQLWIDIKQNKRLDLPSIKVAYTKIYCQHIVEEALKVLLEAKEYPQDFEKLSDTLLYSSKAMFDKKMAMYDEELKKDEWDNMIYQIKKVTTLRKLLSNNRSAASRYSLSSREAIVLKNMAGRQFLGEKGRGTWIQVHGKLVEAAVAIAGNNTRTAIEALEVAKDAYSFQAWARIFEDRVSDANPAPLKDLVLSLAYVLDMTPLCDSEPVYMVDEDSDFCEGNVDRIINCSAELSAPNAPYAVISIIGGRGSGKSCLLNHLFGTKFPEMDPGNGRSRTTRGIMVSRCIGPSLLLLDFEGFRTKRHGQDTTFQKQATLFALTVSDFIIVNMTLNDIGREEGCATSLFKIMFQERTKLPQGFTKIIVVVRYYDGEPPFASMRSNVEKFLEMVWKNVHVENFKFKGYIEVNIVGLPDKNSPDFQKKVALLRKILSNTRSAKIPASDFSIKSNIIWDTILKNKEHDIPQLYTGETIISSDSSITSRFSSEWHAEAGSSTRSNNNLSATEPRVMTFHELHHMTNGFSEERLLGIGGCGRVYKGVLDNREVIAVKKLNSYPVLSEESFKNELLNPMRVQHKNIIRLVGYCSEIRDKVVEREGKLILAGVQERALCFEYMQGGTLKKLLSDESCGLDWDDRCKIIKGICHGLKFLHTRFKDPIYHLDLKPANILLDEDRIPKIGDFGLSRLLDSAETFVTKTFSGTNGYMPPEYIDRREVSPKFDVFSLGVIILEVLAGRNAYNNYKSEFMTSEEFTDHVSGNWRKREQAKPMTTEELLEVQKCIKMALRCVEDDRANRPTITQVVKELNMMEGDAEHDTIPSGLSI